MDGKQEEIHNILVGLLSGKEEEIYNVLYKKKEIDDKTPKLRTEDEKKRGSVFTLLSVVCCLYVTFLLPVD